MPAIEVRPQGVQENHLGVGGLPDQEVRGALLTGGAHEQIDVGHVGLVEVLRDGAFGDLVRIQTLGSNVVGDFVGGVGDLCAATVVDTHREGQSGIGLGHLLGRLEFVDHRLPQSLAPARPAHPDTEFVHLVASAADHIPVEAHQEFHFLR